MGIHATGKCTFSWGVVNCRGQKARAEAAERASLLPTRHPGPGTFHDLLSTISGGDDRAGRPWPPSGGAEPRPPLRPRPRPLLQRVQDAPGHPELSEAAGGSPTAPHPSAPPGGRPRPCPRPSGQEGRQRAARPVRVSRPRRG